EKPLERRLVAARGTISSSLFEAGSDAGVPYPVLAALMRTYSHDVDFQRELQPGDEFEILYERFVTEDGEFARDGEIHYASLKLSGKRLPLYRHEDADGSVDYFNAKGESIRKALLKTPVDGFRLSSGFGMRRHPVLGYSKMHKGADFAAPAGTPIYAAGNGVVEEAGPKGSYGNYVRIRHNGEISTAYAHMSRFGKSIRRGVRVSQGDVIGYVGSTGRSTGAHLHYEVLKGSKQVNPVSVTMPAGRTLAGRDLKEFQARMAKLDREFEQALSGIAMASASEPATVVPSKACAGPAGC
ncbi:MAG TPA: M23 family metallopeptidase, partial [Azospirillaceae bacterium]|nr:M23 family metallopeptidase [Azospirillaceae bacterium]